MSATSSFYLQTRFSSLENFKFKKGEVEIKGSEIVDMLKEKHRSVNLYQS